MLPTLSCQQRANIAPAAAGSLPHTSSKPGRSAEVREAGARLQRGQRRRRAGGGGSGSGARLGSVCVAASSQQGPETDVQPVLVLAGFPLHELAAVRALLDQAGGQEVRVVPTTPAMLHAPTGQALQQLEPLWDQPAPPDWVEGGGWGQQRMVLIAGLEAEAADMLLELFEAAGVPGVVPALATPANAAAPLGQVLAAALKDWRQAGAGRAAAAARPPPVRFVEDLPPAEAAVTQAAPAEAPAAAPSASGSSASGASSEASAGASSLRARQVAASAPNEVVQAEFSERSAGEGGATPLDMIDAIATGVPPRAPPLSTAAPAPSAAAAGAAAASSSSSSRTEEPLDSEELVAQARAALGLDTAEMQRLVDEAVARAAGEAGIPFVASDEAARAAGSASRAAAASAARPRPRPAAAASGSRPRPWEAPSSSSSPADSSGPAPDAQPSKGFGATTQPPSRKAAKAAAKVAAKRSSQSMMGGGGSSAAAAAAAAAAPEPAAAARPQPKPAPAPALAEEEEEGSDAAGGEAGGEWEGGATLPPVDQFVLSASQLKAVTEKHGLDYEELLAGLEQRGIKLVD